MKNTLKIDHDARTIVMDRTFAKYAEKAYTDPEPFHFYYEPRHFLSS